MKVLFVRPKRTKNKDNIYFQIRFHRKRFQIKSYLGASSLCIIYEFLRKPLNSDIIMLST